MKTHVYWLTVLLFAFQYKLWVKPSGKQCFFMEITYWSQVWEELKRTLQGVNICSTSDVPNRWVAFNTIFTKALEKQIQCGWSFKKLLFSWIKLIWVSWYPILWLPVYVIVILCIMKQVHRDRMICVISYICKV